MPNHPERSSLSFGPSGSRSRRGQVPYRGSRSFSTGNPKTEETRKGETKADSHLGHDQEDVDPEEKGKQKARPTTYVGGRTSQHDIEDDEDDAEVESNQLQPSDAP